MFSFMIQPPFLDSWAYWCVKPDRSETVAVDTETTVSCISQWRVLNGVKYLSQVLRSQCQCHLTFYNLVIDLERLVRIATQNES